MAGDVLDFHKKHLFDAGSERLPFFLRGETCTGPPFNTPGAMESRHANAKALE